MAGRVTNSPVAAWLEQYGAAALTDVALAQLGAEIDDALVLAMPELAADESVRSDLRASTRAVLRSFITALARDTDEEYELPPEARDLARAFARRRIDLAAMLRIYRVGQDIMWRRIMDTVWSDVPDEQLGRAILRRIWEQLARRLDTSLDTLVATYTDERERRLRGALARRVETVEALLRGDAVDPDEAEATLGHPLRRHQTAFVLWAGEGAGDPLARMEDHAAALADALGGSRALALPAGARALWAWVATDREPSLSRLRALRAADGVRAAAGTTGYGITGFRASHREALRAQRVASAGAGERTLTLYGDVELVALVSEDPDVMRALVARELGGLAARDAASTRLRETALAYLRAGGNARVAADTLGTHKNTILYRMRSVEEMLGRPVQERRLNLEIALAVVEAFGERVLPGPG
jgi:DNA-binding PucR family transcriptional regulator